MTDQNAGKLPRRKNLVTRAWLRIVAALIFLVGVNLLVHGFRVTLCADAATGTSCFSQAAIGETWAWVITGATLVVGLVVLYRGFRPRG